MDLIIVESPTKSRTLARFLGQGYLFEATMGHIKDLPKNKLGVDIENNFAPEYIVVDKRKETIKKIKEASAKADKIYLATDPDREGEAIAWHVKDILLDGGQTKSLAIFRIVFHEITKKAVEEAIASPRDIDKNLVDAQTARRVLDRLVGYKLSPILWKKIRRGLSAGRVQSVAVRLIVEKEKEIKSFKSEEYWEIYCRFKVLKSKNQEMDEFTAQLVKIDGKRAEIKDRLGAEKIVDGLKKSTYQVIDISKKEVIKNPFPPFTTSTMTQAASRLFGWSSKKTMSIAQALYEEGLITYHRTDSTNLSEEAVSRVRKFIKEKFGENYLPSQPRKYKTVSKVAQEAHEAIRPTDINAKYELRNQRFEKEGEILYDLIWKRFVACQMPPSIYDETVIEVEGIENTGSKISLLPKKSKYFLKASGQIMKYDGWKKLYENNQKANKPKDQTAETILPEVQKGEELKLLKVAPEQKFTQPPPRYTEASLIKTLEKLGIGRPSTYAPIINTIQVRSYVEKNEGKFFPTSLGEAVNDFLVANFPDIFEYKFTAQMEENLDKIANGKIGWVGAVSDFYIPFKEKIKIVEENSKRVPIETEKTGKKCPQCKTGEVIIRLGRFGKFLSCSNFPKCKYTEKFVAKIGAKCPECKKGEVIIKKTKKGRKFYGCSRYPKCGWASWRKPS